MVKETSTLNHDRPTMLDEKRRMQRELGLAVDPNMVLPRSNNAHADKPKLRRRLAAWLSGSAP